MIGTTISHYEIQKKIGAGGMGVVYLAFDPNLDRHVALKILPAEFIANPERLARFIREAKAASAISHPNVAHIYEIGKENEIHFIAMEFIEGESLAGRMNRHPITLDEILNIARQVVGALQEAHRKKVIHRDIKPANIMITSTGHVKLVDFGLAKFLRDETVSSLLTTASGTELGVVMGTLPYMSPEQLLGHPVDHRTDFFSLGVVLYQLATAKLPFQGNTGPEIADAILHNDPGSVHDLNRHVPAELSKTITRMLSKKAVERQSNADEILSDLERVTRRTTNVGSFWSAFRKPSVALTAVVLLSAILAGSFWQFHRNSRIRWAREEALLQITQLIDKGEYASAVNLALEAEKYIPNDPLLKTLWSGMSSTISIQTEPPGADVLLRDYNSPEQDWKLAGKSPISKMRMPKGHLRMKLTKPGLPEIHAVVPRGFWEQEVNLFYNFKDYENAPHLMARIRGVKSDPNSQTELESPLVQDDYWMDQYEVTNQDYQKFLEGGGYQNKKYWKVPFIKDGREISFDEAMTYFRDATGRPGPLEWEVGRFPPDQAEFPVTGVSWYEAAAYAEFAGKQLPTIHHWYHAAGVDMNYQILPVSNFGSSGPRAEGDRRSMSPFGTYDMAGNISEWCWNETGNGERIILGGSYLQPVYMFLESNNRLPFEREKTVGFRCVKYLSGDAAPAPYSSRFDPPVRDYNEEKPVTDETFQVLKTFYDYPRMDLDSTVESIQEHGYVVREKVTFDAAYGNERIIAYLFLPKNVPPPYQAVIYFPGGGSMFFSSSENQMSIDFSDYGDFLVRSGRAFVYPIYKGTYERGGGPGSQKRNPDQLREWRIQYVKDFRRTIDYLETRKDIDNQKLAYFGTSFGARVGNIIGGVEDRLRVLILEHGGFPMRPRTPETDEINFAPRIRVPVLMINGSFDHVFHRETSQKPMFSLLGTPPQDKYHFIFEGGHTSPRKEIIKVVLDWLDKYLGPPHS